MGIFAIPGSPMYEEAAMVRMLNESSATPAPVTSDPENTNPLTNPNYATWKQLVQGTGQNYGIVEGMLGRNKQLASKYGYSPEGFQAETGASAGGGAGAGGASGGYGGMDPKMLAAINASYDTSRLNQLGTSRAFEKRLRGDFNERFGGAETGLLYGAERENRSKTMASLSDLEEKRNLALASARERAEERALRAREAAARTAAMAAAAYGQGGYRTNASGQLVAPRQGAEDGYGGGSAGYGGGSAGYGGGQRIGKPAGLGMYNSYNPQTGGYQQNFNVGVDTRGSGTFGASFKPTYMLPGGGGAGGSAPHGGGGPGQSAQSYSNPSSYEIKYDPSPPPAPGDLSYEDAATMKRLGLTSQDSWQQGRIPGTYTYAPRV